MDERGSMILVEKVRIAAPKRHGRELEAARRLAEAWGFAAEVDWFGADARLTLRHADPAARFSAEHYADLVARAWVPVFSVEVTTSAPARATRDPSFRDPFEERGLVAEWRCVPSDSTSPAVFVCADAAAITHEDPLGGVFVYVGEYPLVLADCASGEAGEEIEVSDDAGMREWLSRNWDYWREVDRP